MPLMVELYNEKSGQQLITNCGPQVWTLTDSNRLTLAVCLRNPLMKCLTAFRKNNAMGPLIYIKNRARPKGRNAILVDVNGLEPLSLRTSSECSTS